MPASARNSPRTPQWAGAKVQKFFCVDMMTCLGLLQYSVECGQRNYKIIVCPTEYGSVKAYFPARHFGEVLMWI